MTPESEESLTDEEKADTAENRRGEEELIEEPNELPEDEEFDGDETRPGAFDWIRSGMAKVHPGFIIAAIIAVIWIEFFMIPLQSYQNHPAMWIGLVIYLVITLISVVILKYLFSIKYKTVLSVMTVNNLLFIIPIGAIISLATGYTFLQLFSPEWQFTHDFVYIMIVTQLTATAILLFGIWWRGRERAVEHELEEEESIVVEEKTLDETPAGTSNVGSGSRVGLTNGFINGNAMHRTPFDHEGRTNGFTNGFGMINGLTNGLKKPSGKTNGLKPQTPGTSGKSAGFIGAPGLRGNRKRSFRARAKRAVVPGIALTLIFLMLVLPPFLNTVFNANLDDEPTMNWANATLYSDDTGIQNPNIDLKGYRAVIDDKYLWTYMMVEGAVFDDVAPDTSTALVLIDSDRNPLSGYSVAGMGADHMVKVYGYDGKVGEAGLYDFNANRDRSDWNGWIKSGTSSASIFGNVLQTRTQLELIGDAEAPLVYFGFVDSDGIRDQSGTPIDAQGQGGTLVVEQERIAGDVVSRGIIDVMTLRFIANGRRVTVNSVDMAANHGSLLVPLSFPMSVDPDIPVTVRVSLDTSALSEGALIDVGLASAESLESNADIVTVSGGSVRAYVGSPPEAVSIDGAFGDWDVGTEAPVQDGIGEAENPNVDMSEYLTASEKASVYFYLKVEGDIMAGTMIPASSSRYVPLKISKPGGSGGEGVNVQTGSQGSYPLPEVKREDAVYIFIDTDKSNETGYHPTHPFDFPVGADYMVEVKGSDGDVKSSGLFRYSGIERPWDWDYVMSVRSECDTDRLESGLQLSDLGLAWSSFNVYFHIVDWNGDEDYSDSVLSQSLTGLESIKAGELPDPNKNNGFGDGDIDTIDGGSCYQAFGCHDVEDNTQVPISFTMSPSPPFNPGQTGILFQVTINMNNAGGGSLAGVFVRVGPSGPAGTQRSGIENDGWVITSDPNGGTNNYIEKTGLVGAGATTLTWTVTAPSAGGTYYLEHCVHYDNGGPNQERNCIPEQSATVIPEFPVDLIPVIAVMGVVLAVLGKSRMGAKKDE